MKREDNPFNNSAGTEPAVEPADDIPEPDPHEDKPAWYRILRSSSPPASPETVEGNFDPDANPLAHLECAFVKASGSDGLEVWMHLVAAALLAVLQERDSDDNGADGPSGEPGGAQEPSAGGANFTAEDISPTG